MSYSQTEKFFSTLNIPMMAPKTYKTHEGIVGPIIELVAKESCTEAVKTECQFTIENICELEKSL